MPEYKNSKKYIDASNLKKCVTNSCDQGTELGNAVSIDGHLLIVAVEHHVVLGIIPL